MNPSSGTPSRRVLPIRVCLLAATACAGFGLVVAPLAIGPRAIMARLLAPAPVELLALVVAQSFAILAMGALVLAAAVLVGRAERRGSTRG